jgi:transcriptional regulator with XRE-family HTH domain
MARRPATTDEEVAKFRRDAERLTKTHLSGKIAEKLGVGSANFSSYVNGSKRPGKNMLKKFYNLQEMQNTEDNTQDTGDNKKRPDYEPGGPSPAAEEAQLKFMHLDFDDTRELREELFNTLKTTNANYWHGFNEIIKTNQKLAGTHDVMARTNETLVNELLSMRGKNADS